MNKLRDLSARSLKKQWKAYYRARREQPEASPRQLWPAFQQPIHSTGLFLSRSYFKPEGQTYVLVALAGHLTRPERSRIRRRNPKATRYASSHPLRVQMGPKPNTNHETKHRRQKN